MDKTNITKKYTNGQITVLWQSGKCQHSGNCVRGLKAVFNPAQSPWIQMDKASTDEIIQTVNNCPSGALSFEYNEKQ